MEQILELLKKQGEAFDAFKKTHDEQMLEMKNRGTTDPVVLERMGKIEKALDAAVEGKTALEAAIATEAKFNKELEAKLNRVGLPNNDSGKRELELKEFNLTLGALASDRKKAFTALDEKGAAEYKAAMVKVFREGRDSLTPDEVKTLSVGSDTDGGVFVTPDVTGRIVKKAYETSPMRHHASVQLISTDSLEGIEDLDEAGAGYAGEHNQSGNTDTPEVGAWKIPVFWIDTEPKATQQLLDDASVDIEAWLADKVGSKLGRFENREYVTGAANKIRGIVGYDTAADDGTGVAWGKIGHVITGVDGDFAATVKGDKLYDLIGLLKSDYLAGASWQARRTTITAIRKFKDGQGNYMWQPSFVLGQPETILAHPVVRMEDMPVMGANSLSLGFGDLKQAYQIVDRQGVKTIRDHLTQKPYVKFYTTRRTGGGVINFEALKLMKFSAA